MDIVTIQPEPRLLVRPGANDHKLLDRLLTPGMFENPIHLDGIVIEAPHRKFLAELREKLTRDTMVLVDPQVYRLQADTWREHPRLTALNYSPKDGPITWDQFRDSTFLTYFVRSVLEAQDQLKPTHYIAPAFYMPTLDSPWRTVNEKLTRETLAQTGGRVYASLCGSYSALCQKPESRASASQSVPLEVEGVFVLISPFSAYSASQSKLKSYLGLLELLRQRHASVYASHQPAFGLGCMAFGVSGFDTGIGGMETFDYARLVRHQRPKESRGEKGGRKKTFYVERLLTHLPAGLLKDALPTAFNGLVGCGRACCQHSQTNGIDLRYREHFIYTRLDEVAQLRRLPPEWRREEFRERVVQARRLADRVLRDVPGLPPERFAHLNSWDRCFTELAEMKARGATA
jgi:hypothetical protein